MLFTLGIRRHPRRPATCLPALFIVAALACITPVRPASASDVTVASPLNGSHVSSPVWIRAHNIGCDSVPPSAFAYSLDNSTALVRGESAFDIDVARQAISAGVHT